MKVFREKLQTSCNVFMKSETYWAELCSCDKEISVFVYRTTLR